MDVLGPDPRAGRPSVAAVPYTPLPSGDPESVAGRPVKIYRRRWYTLLVFCLLNMTQGLVWNTWGPVSDSASLVFGWTDPQIGLFANLGNISFCLTVFIGAYILDVIGLRVGALCVALLLLISTGVRCLTSHNVVLYWMSVLASLLSGVAGTMSFAGPALFSSVWFPVSQRATANAIVSMFNFLGVSVSFLIGPLIVHYVDPNGNSTHNASHHEHRPHGDRFQFPQFTFPLSNSSGNATDVAISRQRDEIMLLMYVEAAFCAGLLLVTLVYFPARPPTPPSVSASTKRLDFRKGFWELTGHPGFWLLGLAYSIPTGAFGVWGSVLNINLSPVGVSQQQAAWIGFYYNVAGGVAGLGISRISDVFLRHMRVALLALYTVGTSALVWVVLLCEHYIPFSLPSMYAAAILASVCVNGGVPLFYELTCESCFPVAEGIIGGYLTLLNNLVGIVFLSLLYIPHIGTSWMDWTLLGCTLAGIPLLLAVRERYGRLQLDTTVTSIEGASNGALIPETDPHPILGRDVPDDNM